MTNGQIKKMVLTGTPNEIKAMLENRKEVTQQQIKQLINPLREEGVYIEEDNMGQATWYYIWKKVNVTGPHDWERLNLGSQFYWNEGSYNAEGEHSLYNEYGMAL